MKLQEEAPARIPVLLLNQHRAHLLLRPAKLGIVQRQMVQPGTAAGKPADGRKEQVISFRLGQLRDRQPELLRDEQHIRDFERLHAAVSMHDARRNQEHVAAPDRTLAVFGQMDAAPAPDKHELMKVMFVRNLVRLAEIENPQRKAGQHLLPVDQCNSIVVH